MGTAIAGIVGGFIGIDARELVHAWSVCRGGPAGVGGFRAWLAAREMAARRKGPGGRRTPLFEVTELAKLLDVTERTAARSVRRLIAAGLLEWSESAIGFPGPLADPSGPLADPSDPLGDTISGGQGLVSIPRRLLRFLVRGARPALIATALGALLRCLSRRRAGFEVRGRFKASWIARVFGIAERHARDARGELIALGWLEPDPADAANQWAWNRWGRAFRVRLDWRGPGADRPTRSAAIGGQSSYPESDPDPLRENSNPDPAEPGPAGASLGPEDRKRSAPDLRDIQPEDLAETARTLELHRQAVAAGKITVSERDRVRFVAAVEHARAVGQTNPPGLLARIVAQGWWHLIGQQDEDRAARRLREHHRPTIAAPEAAGPRVEPSPALRSPYAQDRPIREPSALGDLLARLSAPFPDRGRHHEAAGRAGL